MADKDKSEPEVQDKTYKDNPANLGDA